MGNVEDEEVNIDWNSFINGMLGALAVVVPAILTMRKIRPEIRNVNSDTAVKWQQIADRAAEREQALLARVERVERILNSQKYDVHLVFTGGENPHVDEAYVKHVLVEEGQ